MWSDLWIFIVSVLDFQSEAKMNRQDVTEGCGSDGWGTETRLLWDFGLLRVSEPGQLLKIVLYIYNRHVLNPVMMHYLTQTWAFILRCEGEDFLFLHPFHSCMWWGFIFPSSGDVARQLHC